MVLEIKRRFWLTLNPAGDFITDEWPAYSLRLLCKTSLLGDLPKWNIQRSGQSPAGSLFTPSTSPSLQDTFNAACNPHTCTQVWSYTTRVHATPEPNASILISMRKSNLSCLDLVKAKRTNKLKNMCKDNSNMCTQRYKYGLRYTHSYAYMCLSRNAGFLEETAICEARMTPRSSRLRTGFFSL